LGEIIDQIPGGYISPFYAYGDVTSEMAHGHQYSVYDWDTWVAGLTGYSAATAVVEKKKAGRG